MANIYFTLPTKVMCKGGGRSAELGNPSPFPVTGVTICYLCDRGFWFVMPLSACVSRTTGNIPALRNSQDAEGK